MSSETKILLLVEGEKVEKDLFQHFYNLYGIDNIKIVAYKTHIYAFYHRLKNDYADSEGNIEFEFIDIPLFLNDYFGLQNEEVLNESDFRDIILVFDFDPQDPNYDSEKLKILLENFSESTDKGKLYINYPMVESFKDISSLEEGDFINSEVILADLERRVGRTSYYKRLVDSKTFIKNITDINKDIANGLMNLHNKKLLHLLNESYNENDKYKILCDKQCEKLNKDNSIWILNTSILHMYEEYGLIE